MKLALTVLLSLLTSLVYAQEVACLGMSKESLELNYLSSYKVMTKDYRTGPFRSPNDFCYYYNSEGTFMDKNVTLEFNEKDICIRATNNCSYLDLKLIMNYMDEHFTRLNATHWKTVDNQFLFTLTTNPALNSADIDAVVMLRPKRTPPPKRKA